MRGKWLAVVVVVVVLGVAGGVAAFSRGGDAPPKQRTPSVAAQRLGDDADLMRRLQRKKLVRQR